jgi:hypothetical protein
VLLDGETPAILAFKPGVSPVSSVYARGVRAWPKPPAPQKESP